MQIFYNRNMDLGKWRTERDSNPRDGSPPTHFPGVRLRPLGHRSVGGCLQGRATVLQGVSPKNRSRNGVYTVIRLPSSTTRSRGRW